MFKQMNFIRPLSNQCALGWPTKTGKLYLFLAELLNPCHFLVKTLMLNMIPRSPSRHSRSSSKASMRLASCSIFICSTSSRSSLSQ